MKKSSAIARRFAMGAGLAAAGALLLPGARAAGTGRSLADVYRENDIDEAALEDLKDCTTLTVDQEAIRRLQSGPAYNGLGILRDLPGKRQYTLYGDSNHARPDVHARFFSAGNTAAMAAGGIRHVCLERNVARDNIYKMVASGFVPPELRLPLMGSALVNPYLDDRQQAAFIETETNGLVGLGEKGVTVHCVDERTLRASTLTPEQERFRNALRDSNRRFNEAYCRGMQTHTLKSYWGGYYLNYLPGAAAQGRLEEAIEAFEQSSRDIEDDTALAARIRAVTNGEPTAVFYGFRHGVKTDDLDDLLGRERCARIVFLSSMEQYADRWLRKQNFRQPEDPPEFLYFIDTDTVYPGRPFAPDMAVVAEPHRLAGQPGPTHPAP